MSHDLWPNFKTEITSFAVDGIQIHLDDNQFNDESESNKSWTIIFQGSRFMSSGMTNQVVPFRSHITREIAKSLLWCAKILCTWDNALTYIFRS